MSLTSYRAAPPRDSYWWLVNWLSVVGRVCWGCVVLFVSLYLVRCVDLVRCVGWFDFVTYVHISWFALKSLHGRLSLGVAWWLQLGGAGMGWKTWRRPTLPCLRTQYHGRWGFSRPSSGWDRVRAPREDHQVVQPIPVVGLRSSVIRRKARQPGVG
jgi:hypothetical protein